MDIVKILKGVRSVKRLSDPTNLKNAKLDFLFFICPRMKDPGIVLEHGKLTARYVPGLSGFARDRIKKVERFVGELKKLEVEFCITAIFASADSFVLFSPPVSQPSEIPLIPGIKVVSNFEIYRNKKEELERFRRERPWLNLTQRNLEEQRLKKLLPFEAERAIKQEFVERAFAGFALDGLVIGEGIFGDNPAILAVESQGVSALQNVSVHEPISVVELE